MASSSKRIEESSITALKAALLRCPILDPYINSNDKTPSWDGMVFVYSSESQEKANLLGRVPIQGKGTEQIIVSDVASFNCEVTDLKNYYQDGGCIFFLISVDLATSKSHIFYAVLHVYDLKKILDSIGQQKYKTIKLNQFPQNDAKEMATIFMSFVENSRKQISFIGKELPSLEELKSNGIDVEALTFNTSGIGLSIENIESFLSAHDFYLYAKPKGLDVEIPVQKVSKAIVSKAVPGKVTVKGKEFYSSYTVVYENGEPSFRIGKGIEIKLDRTKNRITVNYKPTGTLSDFIKDASCFIEMTETREITLNGVPLAFNDISPFDIDKYRESLHYYMDIKKMLDIMGVTEELQCEIVSSQDEVNLRNFANAILYNQKIGFGDAKDAVIHGPFKIANLSIWIWATKQADGYYKLESFFEPHDVALFEKDDIDHKNPVPASHYLLLNKEAFSHASNMDFEIVKKDICAMDHHPMIVQSVTFFLLNILRGYDEQQNKDSRLLTLADDICEWLATDRTDDNLALQRLNELQIEKRRRTLNTQEIIELSKYTDNEYPTEIRCGAYLLLGDSDEAQKCFDELPQEMQNEFITFPICHFGDLAQGGRN